MPGSYVEDLLLNLPGGAYCEPIRQPCDGDRAPLLAIRTDLGHAAAFTTLDHQQSAIGQGYRSFGKEQPSGEDATDRESLSSSIVLLQPIDQVFQSTAVQEYNDGARRRMAGLAGTAASHRRTGSRSRDGSSGRAAPRASSCGASKSRGFSSPSSAHQSLGHSVSGRQGNDRSREPWGI